MTTRAPRLLDRLRHGAPLLLDGATGTELERRGLECGLPLWSAHALLEAPAQVGEIHARYVEAGADLLTANTFRTQRRVLRRAGRHGDARALTALAVALAREAADRAGRPVAVLGSQPPLEDCYRPDLVPDAESLAREHGEHAENLAAAGVDAVLIETHGVVREALAAARAARACGLPWLVSFVAGRDARLLSGEPLAVAIEALRPLGALVVGVNCLPPSAVPPCLAVLHAAGLPFAVYANLGAPGDAPGEVRREACDPIGFARHAAVWLRAGARLIGGCCGTGPAHIRALRELLDAGPGARGSGGPPLTAADANCVTDPAPDARRLPARARE
jgi:S-methylmethionine-dependent homocysteine/selenocysteine methylase